MGSLSSATERVRARFNESKIDALFDWASPDLPGVAIGISIDGEPVYRKGFGCKGSAFAQPLSPATPMRVGSVTKQFACFAYALLCDSGKASLDDSIGTHLDGLHQVSRQATMRQLMGNTSGLRDALDLNWHSAGAAPVSSQELLSLYSEISDVNAPAGATWIYNNGGFLMLSSVVEQLVGRSLEDALGELIFEPLNMGSTRLQRQDQPGDEHAQLHIMDQDAVPVEAHIGTALAGEGGLISSVDDLLKWMGEMDRRQVGSAELWDQMTRSQTLSNGSLTGYGLGLMRGRFGSFDTIYHPGGLLGGSAQVMKVPELGVDLVAISNRSDVSAIDVVQMMLVALTEERTDAPELHCVEGVYQSARTGRVIELYGADGVQFAFLDGTPMPLEACPDGSLRPAGVYVYLKQTLRLDLNGDTLTFVDFGNPDALARIACDDRPEDRLKRDGSYAATDAPLHANIEQSSASYSLSVRGPFGSSVYRLERLVENVWKLKPAKGSPWGGLVCFTDGGFWFSNGYFTRRLTYSRLP